jgi:DNA-binding HxlR family transcriptional regulator
MRSRFDDHNCSIARTLDILGDWWTLLIIREAFLGTRRFADFQAHLQIARNILSQRLAHLVEHGVLERVDVGQHGRRHEYVLSARGRDLYTIVTALRQWGDRWVFGPGNEPLVVLDRKTGRPIPPLRVRGEDGELLRTADLELRPGPGASTATLARAAGVPPEPRRPRNKKRG